MYFMWKVHHLPPSVYWDAYPSDKIVMQAFALIDSQERNEELERIRSM